MAQLFDPELNARAWFDTDVEAGVFDEDFLPVAVASALPVWQSTGALTGSTSAITPDLPASYAADDILLLFVITANEATALDTANGWALIPGLENGNGSTGGASSALLAVYWKRAVSAAETAPLVADAGNVTVVVTMAVRGCITTGDPWDVVAGGATAVGSTDTIIIPGVTTTVDNCLVVMAFGDHHDNVGSRCATLTAADLTSVTTRVDEGSVASGGSGIGVYTGERAVAGVIGDGTGTNALGTGHRGYATIALKPAAGASGSASGSASGTSTAAAVGASDGAGDGAGDGTSTATAVGASTADGAGDGAATSAATGWSIEPFRADFKAWLVAEGTGTASDVSGMPWNFYYPGTDAAEWIYPRLSGERILWHLERGETPDAAAVADKLLTWQQLSQVGGLAKSYGSWPSLITWDGSAWVAAANLDGTGNPAYYTGDGLVILSALCALYTTTGTESYKTAATRLGDWLTVEMIDATNAWLVSWGYAGTAYPAPFKYVDSAGNYSDHIIPSESYNYIGALTQLTTITGDSQYGNRVAAARTFYAESQHADGWYYDHVASWSNYPSTPPSYNASTSWLKYHTGNNQILADNAINSALGAHKAGNATAATSFYNWINAGTATSQNGGVAGYLLCTSAGDHGFGAQDVYHDVVSTALFRSLCQWENQAVKAAQAVKFLGASQTRTGSGSGGFVWGLFRKLGTDSTVTGQMATHTGMWATGDLSTAATSLSPAISYASIAPYRRITSIETTPTGTLLPFCAATQFTSTATYEIGAPEVITTGAYWHTDNAAVATFAQTGALTPVSANAGYAYSTIGGKYDDAYFLIDTAPVGAADGSSSATAEAVSSATSDGAAAGAGAATGVGASTADAVCDAAGTSTAASVGASTVAGVATAAGTSTAEAVGDTAGSGATEYPAVGAAAGSATAAAVGSSSADSVGAALGLSTALAVSPSLVATTVETLRSHVVSLIAAIAPTSQAGARFVEYRHEVAADFRGDLDRAPQLRRFTVRDTGGFARQTASSMGGAYHAVTFEVVVAYPISNRYGRQNAMDRDDLVEFDRVQIETAIGWRGYASFTGSANPNAVILPGSVPRRETSEANDFLVMTFAFAFDQDA